MSKTSSSSYPKTRPERAIDIDGSLGEGSRFHDTFGYYAHSVGPETITAPAGWEGRLIRFAVAPIRKRDGEAVGWCLSLPDLMLAKLAARRPHARGEGQPARMICVHRAVASSAPSW